MEIVDDIINLVQSCTDELLAIIVVGGTMAGYYTGVNIPSEPMIMVLGFYFMKKGVEAARHN
jgi:hypothetical protein